MADNSNSSHEKKKMSAGKWGIGGGIVVAIINLIMNIFDKGISPSQIIAFINSWPVVLGVIAWMLREFNYQKNETIRNNNDIERLKKYLEEEEAKRKELEQQLEEEKRKSQEKSVEIARMEEQKKGDEREKEDLKTYSKCLEEVIERLEQNLDRKGGKGATTVVCFDEKSRRNT